MALDTYSGLVESITGWLAETSTEVNLAARVPDFITLLEADLNNDRDFRLLDMQKVQTIDPNKDDFRIVLPDNYLDMDYLDVTSDTHDPLTYVAPNVLRGSNDSPGRMERYSIINGELWIYEPSAGTETLEMAFYESIPALTAANPTNWLLTKGPGVYLFGCLCKAVKYLDNDTIPDAAAMWKTDYEDAKADLISANKPATTTGGTKVVSMPVPRVV